MSCVDWNKIKAEYIAGGISYRKLAEKHEISRSKLQARATSEGWVDLKSQAQAKTEAKLVDSISDQSAKTTVTIYSVAEELLGKISSMLARGSYNTKDIKNLTSAVKDIKEITGLKSDADMREQEARIKRLQKDLRATEDEGKPCGVVLLPPIADDLIPPCTEEENDG